MLRLERHEDSRSNDRDDGNRTRDISQSCFARMLNTAIAATSIVFRMIPFAFESLNERITDQCKPLDKIRSKRMSLLALMVGLSILQPCNSWFVSDSISIPSVTSLWGRIVDTVLLTSVNELPNDVSLGLDTECLHGYERDKYANHLHSSSISSVETRDESKR